MTEVYILINTDDSEIKGIFESKKKVLYAFKLSVAEYLNDFYKGLEKYPDRLSVYEPIIKEIQSCIDYPEDVLKNFLFDRSIEVPDYVKKEVWKYRIEKCILGTHYKRKMISLY